MKRWRLSDIMRQFLRNLPLKHKIQAIVFACIALLSAAALTGLHLITTTYDNVLYETAASALSASALDMQNSLNNLNSMADLFYPDNSIPELPGHFKRYGKSTGRQPGLPPCI